MKYFRLSQSNHLFIAPVSYCNRPTLSVLEWFHNDTAVHYRQVFQILKTRKTGLKFSVANYELPHLRRPTGSLNEIWCRAFVPICEHYSNFIRHCPVLFFQSTDYLKNRGQHRTEFSIWQCRPIVKFLSFYHLWWIKMYIWSGDEYRMFRS